jgi:subtilisin family serine protease
MPDLIYANASPRSSGGVSMFEAQEQITAETVGNFFSEPDVVERAVTRLREAGFEVLQVTQATINIAGTRQTYERAFQTRVVAEERPAIKELGRVTTATFLECPDTPLPGLIATAGTPFEETIEGVALEVPRYYMVPFAFAPLKSYWHLRLPGDVSLGVNADRAHRAGITGSGVKVAMVDSGWYKHPFFVNRGYRAAPVVLGPGAANPLADEVGHGTGESANIFAVAPDVELLSVKMNFVNTLGAFNAAVALGPQIITCSWGSHVPVGPLSAADQALAVGIASAVAAGITVIFSAGNGHAGFPGQHPDVISAGGVFMDKNESLQASNYASGFKSNVYPGRRVPDVCGLVGMRPKAIYIMFPLEPGDQIDVGNAGGAHPGADETASNDGWAAFSGTSAAAPQLAGVAALIKQACPTLKPTDIKDILMKTARDVTAGSCNTVPGIHTGLPAGPGPDSATGEGLADAHKAVMVAKVRCLGPVIRPVTPVTPVTPITPVGPIRPIRPTPIRPTPIAPVQPIRPIQPIVLPAPTQPAARLAAGEAAGGPAPAPAPATLSSQDVSALEEMIVRSELEV